jgi:hypothetical protein
MKINAKRFRVPTGAQKLREILSPGYSGKKINQRQAPR